MEVAILENDVDTIHKFLQENPKNDMFDFAIKHYANTSILVMLAQYAPNKHMLTAFRANRHDVVLEMLSCLPISLDQNLLTLYVLMHETTIVKRLLSIIKWDSLQIQDALYAGLIMRIPPKPELLSLLLKNGGKLNQVLYDSLSENQLKILQEALQFDL